MAGTPQRLCACGCGEVPPLATHTNTKRGLKKGEPVHFVRGHFNRRPLLERFWGFVDKRGADECWLWTGSTAGFGYGQLEVQTQRGARRVVMAHRLSFELAHGAIPEGLQVLHRCDTPACVNPRHLFLGTQTDNMRDMLAKGRHVGNRKLTAADVLAIRESTVPARLLAQQFGISSQHVREILRGNHWGALGAQAEA